MLHLSRKQNMNQRRRRRGFLLGDALADDDVDPDDYYGGWAVT